MILILIGLGVVDVQSYQKSVQTTSQEISVRPTVPVFSELLARGLIFAVLGMALAAFGVREVAALAGQKGARPFPSLMVLGSVLLVVQSFAAPLTLGLDRAAWVAIFLVLLIIAQMLRRETNGAGANIAWSVFGILYVGLLVSYIVALRTDFGPGPVLLLIAAVKLSDVGAYATGMVFGRHKLIPWLSPGKTIEGLVGAVIFSVMITILLVRLPIISYVPVLAGAPFTHLALWGIGFALIGHLGDLAESLLKRDAGAKDSGHILPEFGGVLDLIDSLLPTGFVMYIVLKYI